MDTKRLDQLVRKKQSLPHPKCYIRLHQLKNLTPSYSDLTIKQLETLFLLIFLES